MAKPNQMKTLQRSMSRKPSKLEALFKEEGGGRGEGVHATNQLHVGPAPGVDR